MAKINFTLDFNLNKDGIKQAGKELDALMKKRNIKNRGTCLGFYVLVGV